MPRFIKVLGSLNFAISLLVGLVVILSFSTINEAIHGTPFAQENFYRAHWFDIFLALIWINIFCATLTRYPFKMRHIGFVTTHIGILTLLIGAFMTRQLGIEGQMTVFENEIKNKIILEGLTLNVRKPDGKEALDSPIRIETLKMTPHAKVFKRLSENPARNGDNFAVQAVVSSEMMQMNESFMLIRHDADNLRSASHMIGPALFKLDPAARTEEAQASAGPAQLTLFQGSTGRAIQIDLPGSDKRTWSETGLTIQNIRYYPNAKVLGKQLINDPEQIKFNPAVEFDVLDTENRKESHTKFMLFPDFGSLKGGRSADVFGLSVSVDAPLPMDAEGEQAPSFTFIPSKDGDWRYRITSSRAGSGEIRPLPVGQKIATGWMDITVEVKASFQDAVIQKIVQEDPEKRSALPAALIRAHKSGVEETHWVVSGQPLLIGKGADSVRVSVEPKSALMKFSLALKDFRKIDYPGTSNPSSFESDVTLSDPERNVRIERTISMNKPLDYDGYRIFQSSYVQDEELGEASVFTVAKNPGMMLIYPGAALILIGVILLFYFHPFFNDKARSGGS